MEIKATGIRRPAVFAVLVSFFSGGVFSGGVAFGQQDRIGGPIGGGGKVALRGSVHPQAQPQYDQGRAAPETEIRLVRLAFGPSPSQQVALDRLLAEQQERSSANYHRWLTPEQYADRFGLSQRDLDRVMAWLQAEGLTVNYLARGRNWITFSGPARNVELAFSTELHRYRVDGETHIANSTDPLIPAELAGVVLAVRGLDDFRMKPHTTEQAGTNPAYTTSAGLHQLAPDDIATIYHLAPLYSSGINGSGQRIVVPGQSDINLSDIATFRTNILASIFPQVMLVPGSSDPGMTSSQIESDLDLEWVGAVARNANIIYVNSTNALASAEYAISENLAPVISYSYAVCEPQLASATLSFATVAQQANAQGITFLSASDDTGAAGCDTGGAASHGPAVGFPASLPQVTAVGGTEFNEGNGTYWSSGNSSTLESALSYIPETAWNDSVTTSTLAASGGGMSVLYGKPSWQVGPGVPADGVRDVPDVAMAASAQHVSYLVVSGGNIHYLGGTSAATPVFAGIVVLLNQHSNSSGQGNINSNLYRLAQTSAFHDIVTGNNVVPCSYGSPGCTGGSFGYNAGPGYDLVTGLGSVDGYNLVSNWNMATPASAVTISCSPNPVYEQQPNSQGYSWFYTITLSEVAGVGTTLTGFTVNGTDYSSQLATDFGSTTLGAHGILSGNLEAKNLTVPTNVVFAFTGVDAGGRQWSQQLSVAFSGPLSTSGPVINSGGVVPLYSSSPVIQPGSWISIYGANLANGTTVWNGNFPVSLGGVSVTINNKPGYLWLVSPGQINLQAPTDVATGPVSVVVTSPNGTATSTVTLAPAGPSFSLFSARYPAGLILTPNGTGAYGGGTYDLLGPSGAFSFKTRPVKPGETIELFGVGFGPTNPPVPAGQSFSGAAPTVTPVSITIGGVSANVQFSGITGAGLYQFNVVVPNIGSGDQLLQAYTNGVVTQSGLSITVQ